MSGIESSSYEKFTKRRNATKEKSSIGHSAVCRLVRRLFVAGVAVTALRAGAFDFSFRPELVGKASLAGEGYVVTRGLDSAALAPELTIPVQFAYEPSSEVSGVLGYGWRIPQLESSVRWERGGLLWTAPWGERILFASPKGKR